MKQWFSSVCISLLICLCAFPAHAAEPPATARYVLSGPAQALREHAVRIDVSIHAVTEPINAVQGSVQYPARMFAVDSIDLTNSIIRYWQQQPSIDSVTGTISFTGGLPTPGFQGENGLLFSIVGRPRALGTVRIFSHTHSIILANDTNGTILPTKQAHLEIAISDTTAPPIPTPTPIPDTEPPTDLELVVGTDPHLFNNAWFSAFSAVDTASGISHYEIAETDTRTAFPAPEQWRQSNSPYLLKNQNKRGSLFLKAVDNAGNEAVLRIHFNPCTPAPWWVYMLISCCITCILLLARRYARKQNGTVRA